MKLTSQDVILVTGGASGLGAATVRAGLAELDRGEAVPHEAVMADLRAILAQHSPRSQ